MKASSMAVFYKNDSRVKFSFIDKCYNNDLSERGKEAKVFFYTLCREIFKKNLEIYDRAGITFPMLYGERTCYSSIGASLHDMGYAHMSEWGIGFREEASSEESNEEPLYRRVDFWCEKDDRQFWLEFKHFDINIGKNAKNIKSNNIFSSVENKITEALDQVFKIKICKKGYKLAIFNTYLWFHEGHEPKESMNDILQKVIDSFVGLKNVRRGKVLYGVMDFTKCYKDYKFFLNDDRVSHVLMIGIVYL